MNGSNEHKVSLITRIWVGFFRHIPAWYFFFIGVSTLYGAMANFNPSHDDWAWTYIFPETLVLLYFIAHAYAVPEIKRKKLMIAGVLALQVVCFIGVYFFVTPASYAQDVASWTETVKSLTFPPPDGTIIEYYAGRDAIVWGHEITSLIWILLILAHIIFYKRLGGLGFFYGAALLYGMTLESNGVMMKFFFEDQYHLYLPPFHAPVVTMFGWATVFYPCSMVLHKYQDAWPRLKNLHWLWGGLVISIIALMIDIQVDPVATNLTLWTWNSLLREGVHFLGVPVLNFFSWLFAVWVFGSFYLYLSRGKDGKYVYAQSRSELIETNYRMYKDKAALPTRALTWLRSIPRNPVKRAAVFYISDKSRWSHASRAVTMIFIIPVMNLISGLGVFFGVMTVEGYFGPSWTILKAYFATLGIHFP
jgi:hypothetical protein